MKDDVLIFDGYNVEVRDSRIEAMNIIIKGLHEVISVMVDKCRINILQAIISVLTDFITTMSNVCIN